MMKESRNKLLYLILLSAVTANAQFQYKAPLTKAANTKFYAIALKPELSSYVKTDFSDLRIADAMGRWVPHIIYRPFDKQATNTIIVHTILLTENGKTSTAVIIKGDLERSINIFTLKLKNADVERKAVLSGSDDKQNWFIIAEGQQLKSVTQNNSSTNQQKIYFPSSKYAFYKLVIDNEKKDPLQILEVMSEILNEELKEIKGDSGKDYTINPTPVLKQTEQGKFSIIKIELQQSYIIDFLKYTITGTKFFSRKAKLFSLLNNDVEKTWYTLALSDFTIDSDKPLEIKLQASQKHKVLYLVVYNGDNPPLVFNTITTQQVTTFLITELQAQKEYELRFGDSAAIAPLYDLDKFARRITNEKIEQLQYQKIARVTAAAPRKIINNWWIWPAIITVLGLLGFLTWKLTAEMKKT